MKKSLKFIALLLAVAMTFTLFTMASLAESSEPALEESMENPITEENTEPVSSVETSAVSSEESSEPESSEPESSEPESSEPESSEPESSEPESSEPESSEPESSEPESSEPESSEPESSEPESSEPESSEPESSEPESSEPESSEPESSEPESSEPESSEPESSEPPVSSEPEIPSLDLDVSTKNINGYKVLINNKEIDLSSEKIQKGDKITVVFETDVQFYPERAKFNVNGAAVTMTGNSYTFTISGDTKLSLEYCIVAVTFTLNGPGTYELLDQTGQKMEITNANAGSFSEVVYLDTENTYSLKLTPALNYALQDIVLISSPDKVLQGDVYHFRFSSAGTVTATVVPGEAPVVPTEHSVSISVGNGGKITAGETAVAGGSDADIKVKAGGSLEIVVTPNEDYEIDVFLVGDAEVEITDNEYTLNDVTDDVKIQILFKEIQDGEVEGIGVDDIDWAASSVRVDVTDGSKVLLEVFQKIASLEPGDGKYVEFVSANAVIYVPYGGASVGSSAAVDMSVSEITSGDSFNAVKTAVEAAGAISVQYRIYSFNVNVVLPQDTKVAFKLGSGYVNSEIVPVLFDLSNHKFSRKNPIDQITVVSGEGVTDKITYSNENLMICAKEYFIKHSIESAVLTENGTITPVGLKEVSDGESVTYAMSSNEGYVIKKVLVDGQIVPNAVDISTFTYSFDNVTADHTIKVEFGKVEVQEPVSSEAESVPVENPNDGESDNTTIVILIIAFVAIAGAAALFIVKWRQEKF